MNLTEFLSGSDVLTRMDYKKLANEPQRPLLYCPGEESWGQTGKLWRDEPGSSGSQGHGWCQAPTQVQIMSFFHFLKNGMLLMGSGNVIGPEKV